MAVQIFYKIDLGYVLLQSFVILFRKSWERKWWFQIILDTNILTKVGRAREYDLGFKVRKTIFVQPTDSSQFYESIKNIDHDINHPQRNRE